ncbi:MAG: hypothetical protein AABY32_07400 [Nanoarchaeota archaeon]
MKNVKEEEINGRLRSNLIEIKHALQTGYSFISLADSLMNTTSLFLDFCPINERTKDCFNENMDESIEDIFSGIQFNIDNFKKAFNKFKEKVK